MNKLLAGIVTVFTFFTLVSTAYASPTVDIRLEHPQSPTSQNSINLTFVALTTTSNGITVKCFKKSPSDGDFSQFGSDINLSAGGNTDFCPVDSSILGSTGSHQFYITANDGVETATSEIVTVDYKTGSPDTPVSYSKEHPNSCDYLIKFKTANDGKTEKVVIYRSDQTNFTADSGTEVGTVNIGPNQEGSFTNSVPDCNKTYYFVIRAFDNAGNGSGTTGDSVTITNASTVVASPTTIGAIPVLSSSVGTGEVLAAEASESASQSGQTLGESTPSAEEADRLLKQDNPFSARNILLGFGIILIIGGAYYYFKTRQSS